MGARTAASGLGLLAPHVVPGRPLSFTQELVRNSTCLPLICVNLAKSEWLETGSGVSDEQVWVGPDAALATLRRHCGHLSGNHSWSSENPEPPPEALLSEIRCLLHHHCQQNSLESRWSQKQ